MCCVTCREFRTDVAFVSTKAFSSSNGLGTADAFETADNGDMLGSARLMVLLANHARFGQRATLRYADLKAIDVLVANAGMSESDARS